MQSTIKIGLTYTGSEEKHNNYINWLKGDDDIEIIRLSAENNNLEMVNEVDAVVLSGGVDAHPKTYSSASMHYPNAPSVFNEERDVFETAVFNLSQSAQMPLLAICRGMQLVSCILGGDMIQDIGPEANIIHRNEGTDKRHAVQITPGSLLNKITGETATDTNSAHHQAVGKLGEGLQISATSIDGFPEAIEWADNTGKPFFLGIQWHPERMYQLGMQASPLSKNIRDYFLQVIKKRKAIQ